jgi:hypothetical protein
MSRPVYVQGSYLVLTGQHVVNMYGQPHRMRTGPLHRDYSLTRLNWFLYPPLYFTMTNSDVRGIRSGATAAETFARHRRPRVYLWETHRA